MSFWQLSVPSPDRAALKLGGDPSTARTLSYQELGAASDSMGHIIGKTPRKRLGALICRNDPITLIIYLAALRCGDAVMLLNEDTDPGRLQAIFAAYRPDWIASPASDMALDDHTTEPLDAGWRLWKYAGDAPATPIHPDLAVLLSTSGTTGSPKMVRLSYHNIDTNARAIADYLAIRSDDLAVTTLPFNYSYGMSVVNSHLQAGAGIVLTDAGLLTREFWDTFRRHGVTSLAGVPYTYQILHRLNPRKLPLETLRTLTQAGGRLSLPLTEYFRALAEERGWRFFVMYGQTEAAPRISYIPPESLKEKAGSIGIAIPGGRLSVSEEGELIYEGANVMMGYALCRDDLAKQDESRGRLATGDLAKMDEDGYFFLHGRLKRIIKIHGNRVSLDEVEHRLESALGLPVAVAGEDDKLHVFLGGESTDASEIEAKTILNGAYHLHASTFMLKRLAVIPVNTSGKKDYGALPK